MNIKIETLKLFLEWSYRWNWKATRRVQSQWTDSTARGCTSPPSASAGRQGTVQGTEDSEEDGFLPSWKIEVAFKILKIYSKRYFTNIVIVIAKSFDFCWKMPTPYLTHQLKPLCHVLDGIGLKSTPGIWSSVLVLLLKSTVYRLIRGLINCP